MTQQFKFLHGHFSYLVAAGLLRQFQETLRTHEARSYIEVVLSTLDREANEDPERPPVRCVVLSGQVETYMQTAERIDRLRTMHNVRIDAGQHE